MANPKGAFYSSHLYVVLTAGAWASDWPSRAVNKLPLSWPELLRKFRKHCPQSLGIAEVTSHTHALALLLIRSQEVTSEALDGDHTHPEHPLALGAECLLLEERRHEGQQAYDALIQLPKSNSVYLTLAYYAYALGRYDVALSHLSSVSFDELANVGPVPSTLSVPVPHATGSTTGSAASIVPSVTLTDADIIDGKVWTIIELIRGRCLQGMAYESLSPPNVFSALTSYELALPLLDHIHIPTFPPPSTPPGNKIPNDTTSSFIRYRELWRWVERLLWRAAILSAQIRSLTHTHRLLKLYQSHSRHWLPTFRPTHRSIIAQLYLHLLLRTYTATAKTEWINETRSVVTDYRTVLSETTTFPRAGEHNVKVEEFVDLCVAAWDVTGGDGEQVGWVIDILWWATRFTFNSHRIYRHLTRTLYIAGDTDLARRTLRLYVQLVGKAREASRVKAEGISPQNETKEKEAISNTISDESESDRAYIETLVQGARMLCRVPGGIEEAREAEELLRRADERLDVLDDPVVAASYKRAKGVWHACMALREQDPATRPTHLSSSLKCLKTAHKLHPTAPSTHFHLALALARPGHRQPYQNQHGHTDNSANNPTPDDADDTNDARDLFKAVEHAREAVEGDPREVRYWHLLGLLLAAVEDWTGARAVLELGAGVGDEEEEEGEEVGGGETSTHTPGRTLTPTPTPTPGDLPNGHVVDSDVNAGHDTDVDALEMQPPTLLPKDAVRLPAASTLQRHVPDYPPPSRHERFEHALQLRLTQLALIEHVDGPENAGEKWVEVFSWVATRKGLGEERRPISVEPPPSEGHVFESTAQPQPQSHIHRTTTLSLTRTHSSPAANMIIPINLIPPSPLDNSGASPNLGPGPGTGISARNRVVHPLDVTDAPDPEDTLSEKTGDLNEKSGGGANHDTSSKGKKVQRILKERVHKGQAHIHTISRKIGRGSGRHVARLKRSNSAPDFHAVLTHSKPYQASSIHSRQRLSATYMRPISTSPPPPPASPPKHQAGVLAGRSARERRLLSTLWLTSAATFRRMGKIEQARAAIQEAEVADAENEDVWVQLGLYFAALGKTKEAIASFHKALFIQPDHVPAYVHLTQQYLSPVPATNMNGDTPMVREQPPSQDNIDLAAGLLSTLTRGAGWDVPETWYFLARARGLQGKRDRERECLSFALGLVEGRGVRDMKVAVGWCL